MDAEPDVLAGGREPSGPVAVDARWSALRRPAAVVLVGALVLVGGAALWRRAHPAPLVVPAVTVAVDPSEYLLPQPVGSGTESELLLLLRVSVSPRPGERPRGGLSVVGVAGGGVTAGGTYDVPGGAAGTGGQVTVGTSLSCQDWADGEDVVVRLEVESAGLRASTTAPLDLGPGSPVHAQLAEVCGEYAQAHPLRVDAVSAVLDPTRPTVALEWTVHNPTARVLVVGEGSGMTDLRDPGPDVMPGPALRPVTIVPGATARVRTTLEITTCQSASFDPAGAEVSLSVREPGTGDDVETMTLPMPRAERATAFAAAARACRGAPLVLSPQVSVTLRAAPGTPPGRPRSVVLTVSAQVAADGRWTAAFGRPDWYAGSDAAAPFRDGDATVDAPGDLLLVGQWSAPGCTELSPLLGDGVRVPLVLSAARDYPYALQVGLRSDTSGCAHA